MSPTGAPLVAVSPLLVRTLEDALRAQGEERLAERVGELRVTEVCQCEETTCGSFWTTSRPLRRWFARGRQVEVGGDHPGTVTLDVVRGEIAYVEILGWDEVRAALHRLEGPRA